MSKDFLLRPEELFFLGEIMNAEYIDYSYISLMHDIEKNYPQIRSKCFQDLSRSKLIRKKLNGEISIVPETEKLLQNVFQGRKEAELEIWYQSDEKPHERYRYHFYQGSITEVIVEQDVLRIRAVTKEDVEELLAEKIGVHSASGQPLDSIVPVNIDRVLTARNSEVGVGKRSADIYEIAEGLYTIDKPETSERITDTDAMMLFRSILIGE